MGQPSSSRGPSTSESHARGLSARLHPESGMARLINLAATSSVSYSVTYSATASAFCVSAESADARECHSRMARFSGTSPTCA